MINQCNELLLLVIGQRRILRLQGLLVWPLGSYPFNDTRAAPFKLERHSLIHLVIPNGIRLLRVARDCCMAAWLVVNLQHRAQVVLLSLTVEYWTSVLA